MLAMRWRKSLPSWMMSPPAHHRDADGQRRLAAVSDLVAGGLTVPR